MSKKYYERLAIGSGVSSKKVESSFAENLMKKMGWRDGDGLGKDRDGITDCVQISRRIENQGIGVSTKKAEDSWHEWWHGHYNGIAAKLNINNKGGCIIDTSESESDSSDDNSQPSTGYHLKNATKMLGKLSRVNKQESRSISSSKTTSAAQSVSSEMPSDIATETFPKEISDSDFSETADCGSPSIVIRKKQRRELIIKREMVVDSESSDEEEATYVRKKRVRIV
eukprot:Platyproteum_vivax@DN5412_c0_g1_i1.p1